MPLEEGETNRRLIFGVTACEVETYSGGKTATSSSDASLADGSKNIFLTGECGVDFSGGPGVDKAVILPVSRSYDYCGSLRQYYRSIPGKEIW